VNRGRILEKRPDWFGAFFLNFITIVVAAVELARLRSAAKQS